MHTRGVLSRRYTSGGKFAKTNFGGVAPQSKILTFPYTGGIIVWIAKVREIVWNAF